MPASFADAETLLERARNNDQALTWTEFSDRLNELVLVGVSGAFDLFNTGPEKKAILLDRAGQLADALQPWLILPFLLSPLRPLIFAAVIRPLVLNTAAGLIEAAYRQLKPEVSQ